MNGEELTEQETALYDRQIRIWGADAQRRLSKSHILVSGITGTIVEFCKNVVLAGIGSLTLMDDRLVSEKDLLVNFLIPPDEDKYKEKTIAEVCSDSLRDFNPMVSVSFEKGSLSGCEDGFFDKFDTVIIGRCSLNNKKEMNIKCRKRQKKIAFYTVDCRDSCGEIFVDLQSCKYQKKTVDGTAECFMQYPSFEEAISVSWSSLPKNVSKMYFAMRVIEKFEQDAGRNPGETSSEDLQKLLEFWQNMCQTNSLKESLIPVALLERLLVFTEEHPPVCAIIGGILGQEVIKAISGKGEPLKNFFFFDAATGKGTIEDISPRTDG
ncbi:SUMO-activating enzyme subunit 1A-like isoform X2 [Nymphaea colorata]|nr:SUMO-activating enzyme subunit 1A-like isoform X2 [Nymphaea colorata]XP_031477184.1 SUMO-activating enzyme subunit 1A-like isoform X2 [Nymphaea colorata]